MSHPRALDHAFQLSVQGCLRLQSKAAYGPWMWSKAIRCGPRPLDVVQGHTPRLLRTLRCGPRLQIKAAWGSWMWSEAVWGCPSFAPFVPSLCTHYALPVHPLCPSHSAIWGSGPRPPDMVKGCCMRPFEAMFWGCPRPSSEAVQGISQRLSEVLVVWGYLRLPCLCAHRLHPLYLAFSPFIPWIWALDPLPFVATHRNFCNLSRLVCEFTISRRNVLKVHCNTILTKQILYSFNFIQLLSLCQTGKNKRTISLTLSPLFMNECVFIYIAQMTVHHWYIESVSRNGFLNL